MKIFEYPRILNVISVAPPCLASTQGVWCKNHRAVLLNSRDISRRSRQMNLDSEQQRLLLPSESVDGGGRGGLCSSFRGFYPVETWGRHGSCDFMRGNICRARKNQSDPFIANTLATTP